METNILAFDLGIAGGKAVLCRCDGVTLQSEEIHHFENTPVERDGHLRWNVEDLLDQIKTGIRLACAKAEVHSIGVDTWGMDFALVQDGKIIELPVHYRDKRTARLAAKTAKTIPDKEMFKMGGVQILDMNTLYQLLALKKEKPGVFEGTTLLMMPDLFNWLLTGEKATEITIASTTGFLNPETSTWNLDILARLGLPGGILPPLRAPGTMLGRLRPEICKELGVPPVPVALIGGNEGACAIATIPFAGANYLYLCCATWGLLGYELEAPLLTKEALEEGLSNERGLGGRVTLHKNTVGLWLLQKTRRQFSKEGREYSYTDMENMAAESEAFACFIDPCDSRFAASGDIPARIREYCTETGQIPPVSDGAVVRCIYESIAMCYRQAAHGIAKSTGKRFTRLHIVGGGVKNCLLSQMAASATNLTVKAGPIAAGALGNAMGQLIALGDLANLTEARAMISIAHRPKRYEPEGAVLWDAAYQRYKKVLRRARTGSL